MSQLYVATDTETGGRNSKTTDLLTIYMAIIDQDFKILDELDLKVKPDDGRLPLCEQEALSINKIDVAKHLADPETITYSEAKIKVVAMLKKHLKKTGRYSNLIPMGHNVPFDISYLQAYILPQEEWEKILHYRIVDTMPVINFFKDAGLFPRELSNLVSIIEYLQLPKRNAHSAKDDTFMMVDVYKKLLEIMRSKKTDAVGQQDLISLLEME